MSGPVDFAFDLAGRVAVITGGASGIGAAIAEAYATKGARVAIVDRDAAKATAKADQLGAGATGHVCDVADPDAVNACVQQIHTAHQGIDILVNSAGVARLDPALDATITDWRLTMDVNLTGAFVMSQAVAATMVADQRKGRIISLASQAAHVGLVNHVAYCASKAGLLGMTKVLAVEWGPHQITVNTISPTVVLTELGKAAWDNPAGEAHKAEIPVGRFAEPAEIAAAAVFLASDAAAMINGTDLVVDGGFTIR